MDLWRELEYGVRKNGVNIREETYKMTLDPKLLEQAKGTKERISPFPFFDLNCGSE